MSGRTRRWNGWGFVGEEVDFPAGARAWLSERLGNGEPLSCRSEEDVEVPAALPLPEFECEVRADREARLHHACGQSFADLVALRAGQIAGFPDAVLLPADAPEVVGALETAARAGVAVIPRGGGTSVVGGVTVTPHERPAVVLSLARLDRLEALDRVSLLASFGAGTTGPQVEGALAHVGLRLGHEPQSFELSTVGGWIATRSAGHRSTGVGKIEDLVAGLEVATARGLWKLPPQPASAAGPELRRLLAGSEARAGVITSATLRVRDVPASEDGAVVLFPSWESGVSACRDLLQSQVPLEVLRLSDVTETEFGRAILELSPIVRRASRWLLGRPRWRSASSLLLGWAGDARQVRQARGAALALCRRHDGLSVGRSGWRRWRHERFRHPYLRDALLDHGWGVDTLETATPWRALPSLHVEVGKALEEAAQGLGVRVATLCHLSHAYRDGASLYFTFFWPMAAGRELDQWAELKAAATEALLQAGGTLSHHHGVGSMHARYLEREIGECGVRALRALAGALDPEGILNPGVLVPRTTGIDRRQGSAAHVPVAAPPVPAEGER